MNLPPSDILVDRIIMSIKADIIPAPDEYQWHPADEPRYVAALLYAGAEPEPRNQDAHMAWQDRVAEILMQKFERRWWYVEAQQSRSSVDQSTQAFRAVRHDELKKFYTWVCKQRGEPWTKNMDPTTS